MMSALILSQPILDEYYKNAEDNFVVEFRDEIQNCLHTVFKVIEPWSYFARALLIIRVNSTESSKTEPSLFLITSMITTSFFPGDLKEVMDIILNFPPNIPSFLIHTSCLFLNKYIYYQVDNKKYDENPETVLSSIYRWIASIPFSSTPHLELQRDSDKIEPSYRISSIKVNLKLFRITTRNLF
ncbi:hypothetical protein RF11_09030 [Thelohanellus kitauei]|uniref:Uncharacterized protein n=1 Tax=Thelohanellus kitauei TaxID=669202 RepID=A0A0C2MTQ5_THEKT|nr:hypothetical protein RF11_09030 [Thelohanellus kitauei]